MDEIDKEKIRRLRIWQEGGTAGPVKMDIEIHRRCNLFCYSCSRRDDPKFSWLNDFSKQIEMPREKWLSIVDEAAELDVREWHIAGGAEPMYLADTTYPVMQRIKSHGMGGILTTNGTMWTEKQLRGLVEMGWDRIHFSIDGPDARIHDHLRGMKGAFGKTCSTIRALNSIKEELGSRKPMLNMNSVLSIPNYRRLPEFVDLGRELRVDYMFIEPLIVYSLAGERLKLRDSHLAELPRYVREAQAKAHDLGIQSNFAAFDTCASDSNLENDLVQCSSKMDVIIRRDAEQHVGKGSLAWSCYDPFFHMSIKADGSVAHCDVANDSGDNIRSKALREVWFGGYFQEHRSLFMRQGTRPYCSQCNASHTTQRRWLRKHMQEYEEQHPRSLLQRLAKKLQVVS